MILLFVAPYLFRKLFGGHWFRNDADVLELLLIRDLIFALGDGFVFLILFFAHLQLEQNRSPHV